MNAAAALRTELRILANRLGPHITLRRFCDEVGVAPSTVSRCCGSWTQLRIDAGLPPRSPRGRLRSDLQQIRHRHQVRQFKTATFMVLTFCAGLVASGWLEPPSDENWLPPGHQSDNLTYKFALMDSARERGMSAGWQHPTFDRRTALQAGAVGLLGLGTNHLTALRDATAATRTTPHRSVVYIFLSGGLGQQDSFDLKPDAPDNIRGEFNPIATATPGIDICEHLPLLAQRSGMWSLVRSLTHKCNEHSEGHMLMLTGRSQLPPTFSQVKPMSDDWPSIAATVGAVVPQRNNLPPAVVLPERLIHRTGRVIPGQFAGLMGRKRDPWFIEAAPFNSVTYGAYPEYEFSHAEGPKRNDKLSFQAPSLSLPEALSQQRVLSRMELLGSIDEQRRQWDAAAAATDLDRHRQAALSLLTDPSVRSAFDVTRAPEEVQTRYGKNSFGWSLLMARQLVAAGVSLVQVNLGNNETWDTHGNAFPSLKNFLYPPLDRSVSALLDDLKSSGLLESTLIVMAGEFGRTPKVFGLPQHYKLPGRDHWGAVQTVWLAGGGIQGGRVIGASDKIGGYPADNPQTPENLAATIYSALGLPSTIAWHDDLGRPHHIYHGDPIPGLV